MLVLFYGFLKSMGIEGPVHGLMTPMPIGLATGALFFFLAAILFKRSSLILSARHASILALAFAFPAIVLGVFDWIHFYHGALMPAIVVKMGLSLALLVLLGAGIIVGSEVKPHNIAMTTIYVLCFATVTALSCLGASVAYGRGGSESAAIGLSEAPRKGPESAQAKGEVKAEAEGGEAGESLFESNCSGCHPGGENAIIASLPIKGSKRLVSLDAFRKFVRAPTMPDGKAGDMPPFAADALGDDKVTALYSFVSASFKK